MLFVVSSPPWCLPLQRRRRRLRRSAFGGAMAPVGSDCRRPRFCIQDSKRPTKARPRHPSRCGAVSGSPASRPPTARTKREPVKRNVPRRAAPMSAVLVGGKDRDGTTQRAARGDVGLLLSLSRFACYPCSAGLVSWARRQQNMRPEKSNGTTTSGWFVCRRWRDRVVRRNKRLVSLP